VTIAEDIAASNTSLLDAIAEGRPASRWSQADERESR
jgi:hypothetical protein